LAATGRRRQAAVQWTASRTPDAPGDKQPPRPEEAPMSTPAASSPAGKVTGETRMAKLFGLSGENWMRHANPLSVWTRFAVLPLLVVSIWSRDWIGWWSLALVALSLVFMMVNPLLFKPPASTRNWTSKAVFGERVWSERTTVPVPARFTSTVNYVTSAFQVVGMALMVYGLVRFDLLTLIAGTVLVQCAKAWYLDRMVLLFEEMKTRHPAYAAWEY
jgi:hypothetical protein